MKVTNKLGLPKAFVNAVEREVHAHADYSVTQLIDAPQIYHLKKKFNDKISEDASERVWALFGTAVHSVLQKGKSDNSLSEEYLTADIKGKKISGTADYYEDGVLSDWKTTSVWSIIYGSRMKDWTDQLNAYAHLYRENGFEVKKLQIVAILRDWSKTKAKTDANYPQSQVVVIDIPLQDETEVKDFLGERVIMFEDRGNIPECTSEEMWEKETTWAIKKGDNKRAVKVHKSLEEAAEHLAKLDDKHTIKERKGERIRCEEYCPVKDFCPQYKKYKGIK